MSSKEKNYLNMNNNYIYNNINNEDFANINKIGRNNNENICNNHHNLKIISQNYFKNPLNNSQKEKMESINKYKSEEINLLKTHDINEYGKKNDKLKNMNRPSEITTKSLLGSMTAQYGNDINTNIHRLMTEQEIDEINLVNSKSDLISEKKNIKIDENENEEEEDEEEEVIDEYDEKIKDDNNRKIINNLNIMKTNCLHNIDNNESKNEYNEAKQDIDIGKIIKSAILNSNIDNNNNYNNKYNNNNNSNIYRMCSICEHTYLKLFVAECNDHYICKRCAKNYYEEIIEDGIKELFCPFVRCKAKVNLKELKNIISPEHYNRLINQSQETKYEETQNKLVYAKLKTNCNKENIQIYTKKHVIDINSNKNFYDYNSFKEVYCPHCFEESLFSKTNTHYFKCLNCLIKICKYCFKEYIDRHIDIHYIDHCKVYYRLEDDQNKRKILFFIFLLQLIFVFACFYFTFVGSFYFFRDYFFKFFNTKNNGNFIKYFFTYFFSMVCFIISVPFIFLFYPYFPSIIALFDY